MDEIQERKKEIMSHHVSIKKTLDEFFKIGRKTRPDIFLSALASAMVTLVSVEYGEEKATYLKDIQEKFFEVCYKNKNIKGEPK